VRLSELIIEAETDLEVVRGETASVRVCDITEDSRTALPGSLFAARPGGEADGRRFIGDAVAAGAACILTDAGGVDRALAQPGAAVLVAEDVRAAVAALAEAFYGKPSRNLTLIGVTGTNGKTTVAHLVQHQLATAGLRCGLIGTVEIDDGSGRHEAEMTTPPAAELSRTLAAMVEAGCTTAVMEVSSHALEQRRADGLAFDIGVATNLTRDHLDYHGSMHAYAAAKRRLFELVDAAAWRGLGMGLSIVNADDPEAASLGGRRPIGCSIDGRAIQGWSVRAREQTIDGIGLSLEGPRILVDASLGLIGRHNAMNACQAVAAADAALIEAGFNPAQRASALRRGLETATAPPGRMERVEAAHAACPRTFVDFAHTADALDRSLAAVRAAMPAGAALWVVFGAGGERDRGKRPGMGAAVSRWADRTVLTSDNPRREPVNRIISDVLAGVPESDRDVVIVHADRRRAIEQAVRLAEAQDVVVIAGKGHERFQIETDESGALRSTPFDDRIVAAEALRARAGLVTSSVAADPQVCV